MCGVVMGSPGVCESWTKVIQDDIALTGTGGGRRGVRSRGWAGWEVCELRLVSDQAVRRFMCRVLFTDSSERQQHAGETFQLPCT
jgi:hypothetical protein